MCKKNNREVTCPVSESRNSNYYSKNHISKTTIFMSYLHVTKIFLKKYTTRYLKGFVGTLVVCQKKNLKVSRPALEPSELKI